MCHNLNNARLPKRFLHLYSISNLFFLVIVKFKYKLNKNYSFFDELKLNKKGATKYVALFLAVIFVNLTNIILNKSLILLQKSTTNLNNILFSFDLNFTNCISKTSQDDNVFFFYGPNGIVILECKVLCQLLNKILTRWSLLKKSVLKSMTTYDIEPRADSLGMVLYNLWVHISQASANFVFELLKIFGLPITLINFSFQIFAKIFDWSCFGTFAGFTLATFLIFLFNI
ncbi:hypothetical protein BpHYR1_051878 [Brachionus plicatilis]|uniref:Uncharacterized protein n=1 Tax=Brachionus plicatilis TaxID=10195 RepID=A0A3M7RLJ8_BRAPC|nr:hypothetical protein BpHYR1_051878 [Brachionus plicatilis]